MTAEAAPAAGTDAVTRVRPGIELLLVLGVSLGQSAVYSILSIIDKLTINTPLNQQTTSMNNSVVPDRPWLDLAYHVAGLVFPLVPALFALYLLQRTGDRTRIGLDFRRPRFDLGWGFGLAAAIGIPGLALYFAARAFGLNTNVEPANLAANWWTVPVLVGAALMNGLLEEIVMIGFWFVRGRQLNWPVWVVLVSSAVVRGSYHLYQGFGGFLGNLAMGTVFAILYRRWGRVMPFLWAHLFIDATAFLGYYYLGGHVSWLP